jgi:spermidine synthase
MSATFEELDWAPTPIGDVSLRKRLDPVTREILFEVKLGDEYLMSSMFTVAEIALARIGLERLHGGIPAGDGLDVAVGGLGLGYTAQRVLEDPRVRELVVVELLDPVIGWHRQGLVPVGPTLTGDARCRLVQGDFFEMSDGAGFDPGHPNREFDAVLLDIDHSPQHLLADGSAGFYGAEGTRRLASHIALGGVYALWSNDPPDDAYVATLAEVFTDVAAEVVTFPNPLQGRDATNTVYVATKP